MRMFTHDEPLALLVWTEEGIHSACWNCSPTDDDEVTALLETVGNSAAHEGVSPGRRSRDASGDLLTCHREAD